GMERPLIRRQRHVEGDVYPLIGERECGAADDEVVTGLKLKVPALAAAMKHRIPGLRQDIDVQPPIPPLHFDMPAGNPLVPRRGPRPRSAANHLRRAGDNFAPPAMLRLGTLSD